MFKFVIKQYANSLNGYDDFLTEDVEQDRYSKKIVELKNLQKRLRSDIQSFEENNYEIRQGGRYQVLQNDSECRLIRDSVLFGLHDSEWQKEVSVDNQSFEDWVDNKKELIARMKSYSKTIDYELETINHMRRINWQNMMVHEYADEESALAKELKRMQLHSKLKEMSLYCVIVLALALVLAAVHAVCDNWMIIGFPIIVPVAVSVIMAASHDPRHSRGLDL